MRLWLRFALIGLVLCTALSVPVPMHAADDGSAPTLLEPIDGPEGNITTIDSNNPNFIIKYLSNIFNWVWGMAAGATVAWGLWGGSSMIMAGSDQGKFDTSKKQIINAIIGLLVILFVGVILKTINPSFFSTG